jgi:hypothetical protein
MQIKKGILPQSTETTASGIKYISQKANRILVSPRSRPTLTIGRCV